MAVQVRYSASEPVTQTVTQTVTGWLDRNQVLVTKPDLGPLSGPRSCQNLPIDVQWTSRAKDLSNCTTDLAGSGWTTE